MDTILNDVFVVTVQRPVRKRKAKTRYRFNGRLFHVQKNGADWIGYFDDDHSVEFVAATKRELLEDARNNC